MTIEESLDEEGDSFFANTSTEIDSLLPTTVSSVILCPKCNADSILHSDNAPKTNKASNSAIETR